MDNNALLLLAGAKKIKQTIGKAGQQGFGVGVYGGDPADLTAIGLSPMQGCEDPASENYGNYIHTNGSVMVFIPAFCYRIGNTSAPSYSRDGANALEIRDASFGEGDGWILHRAFIDGGVQKFGFFVDKYLCSKKHDNPNIAVSVKDANPISLSNSFEDSRSMLYCSGLLSDAITLGRARGEGYACVSAFQWAALSILSLACGQAATSSDNCAWYDANHSINFPKGANTELRTDKNDSSVSFSAHTLNKYLSKTGSGTPFAKTTHNGQACGVADVNGCMEQPLLGVFLKKTIGIFAVVQETYKMHDLTEKSFNTLSNFDTVSDFSSYQGKWGNGSSCVFPTETTGAKRAMCGVFPITTGNSDDGTALFGNDAAYFHTTLNDGYCLVAAGTKASATKAGIWYRDGYYAWDDRGNNVSFRVAGYAR